MTKFEDVLNPDGTLTKCPKCGGDLGFEQAGEFLVQIVCQSETGCDVRLTNYFENFDQQEKALSKFGPDPIDIAHVPFTKMMLNVSFYRDLADQYYKQNSWIEQYMKSNGWLWILVCGGRVLGGSNNFDDFPNEEYLFKMALKHKYIPMPYGVAILPEDTSKV